MRLGVDQHAPYVPLVPPTTTLAIAVDASALVGTGRVPLDEVSSAFAVDVLNVDVGRAIR
jgi:hypothetical protein